MSLLDKFIDYDKSEVSSIHNRLEKACNDLDKLEKTYKINNLNNSLKLKYPNPEAKVKALKHWGEIKRLSEELDFIFIED